MVRLDLREILGEIVTTLGRPHLLEHIANLDGNIEATPEPEEPGEAEKIEAEMAALQKRADELAAAKKKNGEDAEGGKSE